MYNPLLKLEEIVDDMSMAIDNLKTVLAQQHDLIEIVNSSEKAETFKEFIKGIETDCKDKSHQLDVLTDNQFRLKTLIESVNASPNKEEIVDVIGSIFIAFNVMSPDEQAA